jgi:hypothetical protein
LREEAGSRLLKEMNGEQKEIEKTAAVIDFISLTAPEMIIIRK